MSKDSCRELRKLAKNVADALVRVQCKTGRLMTHPTMEQVIRGELACLAPALEDADRLDWLHDALKAGASVYVNGDDATAIHGIAYQDDQPQAYHLREAIDSAREGGEDG